MRRRTGARAANVAHLLRRVARSRQLVAFHTRFERGRSYGYVAGVGPELFLMAEIREGWLFDGFRVYRIRDTRELEAPFEHRSFTEEALRLFGVRWTKPRVPLENWSALLSALAPSKGLVVIHREHSSPHTAQIGIVTGVDGRSVTLHEIDPSAEFEDAQSTYRLAEITSIGWGGLYENALHAVWGKRHSKPARVRRRRSMP